MTKKYDPLLNSNHIDSNIQWVCRECGLKAQKASGKEKFQKIISTYHNGTCDFCGEKKAVTEARDFGYPDFNLI